MAAHISANVEAIALDRRSPSTHWTFNITLRNGHGSPRWFVIGDTLNEPLEEVKQSAGVEVYQAGQIQLFELYGTPGAVLVYVAGGATVRIDGLRLTSWEDVVFSKLNAWAVTEILVSNSALGSRWLADNPPKANTSAHCDAKTKEEVASKLNPGLSNEPLTFKGVERLEARLDVSHIKLPAPLR